MVLDDETTNAAMYTNHKWPLSRPRELDNWWGFNITYMKHYKIIVTFLWHILIGSIFFLLLKYTFAKMYLQTIKTPINNFSKQKHDFLYEYCNIHFFSMTWMSGLLIHYGYYKSIFVFKVWLNIIDMYKLDAHKTKSLSVLPSVIHIHVNCTSITLYQFLKYCNVCIN